MDKWQSLIDQQIRKAIGDGQMSGLPGAGKPLNLDENPYAPPEMRMAHKIMRENDIAPDWIMLGRELDQKREQLLTDLQQSIQVYIAALTTGPLRRRWAEANWQSARRHYSETVEALNKQITSYNLKVPPGVNQRSHINLEREIARLLADRP